MATYNPDIIMLGGDIVYDNGFPTCYESWDSFYSAFDFYAFTPNNRIIPFILSVGNHDIGLNAISNVNRSANAKGPLYFAWNPQNSGANL